MKWEIDKSFSFAYGHRVWSQELDANFVGSEGVCLACRHLHGHEGLLKVHLAADELTRGMVVDFKMLGWFKDFVDDVLDHKMIMDINDPLLPHEVPEYIDRSDPTNLILDLGKCVFNQDAIYWTPDLSQLGVDTKDPAYQAIYEKYEGMVFVDFVPTSENLAAWLLGIAREKMAKIGVNVSAIEFNETTKSHVRVEQ